VQTTEHLLMIRPARFGFNAETAVNNFFQEKPVDPDQTHARALAEFEEMVRQLERHHLHVLVVPDSLQPATPDPIFPNNWFSTHADGTLVPYPLSAPPRRRERKPAVLNALAEQFQVDRAIDFTRHEEENRFLEGTGSLVLDRLHRIAYACLSPRTDPGLLELFCERLHYTPLPFTAVDTGGRALYHTNVVMTLADRYAVVCLDSIPDPTERIRLTETLKQSGKTLIPLQREQLTHFAGNLLQVHNQKGDKILIGSTRAFGCLTPTQRETLQSFKQLLEVHMSTIETIGGGRARCMIAEIHLPLRTNP